MNIVPLATDWRLSATFARYDAEWACAGDGLVAARVELCEALLACGEAIPASVLAQLARDRATMRKQVIAV